MTDVLRAATRRSTLARTQTDLVAALLGVPVEPVLMETSADRRLDVPVWELGGQGAFVREVQAAVLDGRADFAVHSAKDLPSTTAAGLRGPNGGAGLRGPNGGAGLRGPNGGDGLALAAVPEREDPRDALVGSTFEGLPPGGQVGTGSVRRRAQLAWLRPDLTFGGLRGNMETRLSKADEFDAIVVAYAALRRLGRTADVTEVLETSIMLPQVGQGAMAVECRADDTRVRDLLAAIEHGPSRRAVDAERAWLATLGGGCDQPVGAHATVDRDGGIRLTAMVAADDGHVVVRQSAEGDDPGTVGRELALDMLERGGAGWIMEESSLTVAPAPS